MPRRKKLFKIPFLSPKVNNKTISRIFGFCLLAAGSIGLFAIFGSLALGETEGRILHSMRDVLIDKFGVLAFIAPLLLIVFSVHFFSTKKIKLIRYHISTGSLLLFISLLGLLESGSWGEAIFQSLKADFSKTGAFIILTVSFIIGLVLFLDTSVDAFLIFCGKTAKVVWHFVTHHLLRTFFNPEKKKPGQVEKDRQKKEAAFIHDKQKQEIKPHTPPAIQPAAVKMAVNKTDIKLKPVSHTSSTTWIYPPLNLLNDLDQKEALRGNVKKNADTIEKTLDSFGIRARVSEVNYGPAVTQYALEITMGTKLSKITALSNDLALALAAPTGMVRIEAPIPGRSLVGIEIPNIRPELVTVKQLLSSSAFEGKTDPLLVPLGLDVSGEPKSDTIGKMPHILIAGTTGSGKSVLLNAWITTFLFRTKPSELQMILVDPKRVELSLYNGIPHLLTEVITEPSKILSALRWTVAEMEQRYKDFVKAGVRNLDGYNKVPGIEKKPYILFVIDELADLMIFASNDAEELITRIAQMARATGIHLILATQRPSVDVITGLMKANIPTRVAFSVSSLVDSRVIIDMPGAEKLLGKGDMLYLPADQAKPRRIQGPFITEKEVTEVVKFLKAQVPEVHYTEEILSQENMVGGRGSVMPGATGGGGDALFNQAIEVIMQSDKASASLLQRKLRVGYARAARILDELEEAGYVGPSEGSKPRQVIRRSDTEEVPTIPDEFQT